MKTQNTDKKVVSEPVKYTLEDVGCYVDGAYGVYAVQKVVTFAYDHGARSQLSLDRGWFDSEFVGEIENECDEYMNDKYGVEGAYWGRNENSDWGLWAIEED